jgi:outer membrane receptor protein involved in Fe transport
MKNSCFFIFFFLIINSSLFSQGIVRGKITDESGEALIGAAVSLKSNRAIGVLADLDGNYSIKLPEGKPETIIISYVSYKTQEQAIKALGKNEVLIKNITLLAQESLEEIVIVAKQVKANDYYMENKKKESATTIDYISSETMKKTGDPNVVAAVARVSGVSTNGGLITVRGIGDRYVKTTLNGSRIPTLDPLTNNIKLDLFPANLVDNIIITKTANADLPSDWAGAYISIETKDYPEKLVVNIESKFGYNAQTTGKDYISSDRSSTDWLGFDNGLRNRTHEEIPNPNNFIPSIYEEMSALGLKNYYASLGVTKPWDGNSAEASTYFKLGLVQLGLLGAAVIDDETAYQAAIVTYNNTYKKQAFSVIHPEGKDFNNGFSNNWNTNKRKAPINFSQNLSVGNQTTLFKRPFGYFFGFQYGTFVRYDPNGTSQRLGGKEVGYAFEVRDNALISRETNAWSALINLAYKLNEKNSLSFLFMPNFIGTNDVASYSDIPDNTPDQEGRTTNNQFYEQRRQLIYQVKSEHFIAGPKLKIEFNASYTDGNSVAPDFKVLEYGFVRNNFTNDIFYTFGTSVGEGIQRNYRYLSDNIFDSRISGELPISKSPSAGVRKIKFGGAYQRNDRKQNLYDYKVAPGNTTSVPPPLGVDADINQALSTDNFVMTNQQVTYVYQLSSPQWNNTFGKSTVTSVFALVDYSILSYLRFSGGLRLEKADIITDVVSYYNLGYKYNDIRRENVGGYPNVNTANINDLNLLPSANLIFKLKENKLAQLNFRLNYSRSIARPSMRELNDAAILDNEFRTLIYGNSSLQSAQINNYDFRFETYFKNDDNISLSFFFKDFTNHIEMSFGSGGLTWNNVGRSTVKGIELEGKKRITKQLEFRTNFTFVQSNSQVIRKSLDIVNGIAEYVPIDTINRSMFGQAPYIINCMLAYTADSLGLTATISYNVQGPRLVITGILPGRPDVYEMPRNTIDFKISKTLWKHFYVTFAIRDLLNAPVRRAYKLDDGRGYVDYDNFAYGTNYLFSFGYKL